MPLRGGVNGVVCALAPDNIHMTHYELTVIVKPIYSVKLESLKVNGKGHKLEPDFHPDVQQYVIHVDSSTTGDRTSVSLTMFAEDPEADMTLSDGKHEVTANNNITSDLSTTLLRMTLPVRHRMRCWRLQPLNLVFRKKAWDVTEFNQQTTEVFRRLADLGQSGNLGSLKHELPGDLLEAFRSDSEVSAEVWASRRLIEVGEPPQWSKAASIILTSSDGGTTMTYVDIKQHVSNYSYLKNLTMGDTKCVMDPPVFQQNITKYYCKFWWEDTKSPQIGFQCFPAAQYKKSHLSLQYREMKKRKWESNQAWSRPFLYGEYHTIPFQVLSADKFTHTTYEVTLERDAPWWMKAAFTRQVSQWATTAALVMAVTTASNFLALTSQIQFMDLTTEIHGTPEVYQEFADHLKAANFDLSDYVPDMGLPSFEDVKEMRDKMIKQMQDSFAVGAMKNSGTLLPALEASGQIAANQILHKNKKAALDLRSSLEKYKGTVFKPTEKKEAWFRSGLSKTFKVRLFGYHAMVRFLEAYEDGSKELIRGPSVWSCLVHLELSSQAMALEEETTPEAPSERKSFGDQGSVVSHGTFQTRQTFVTARSASEEFSQVSQDKSPNDYLDLSAEEDEEEDEATLWDSVRELASDRRAQGTAALTLGGYVTVGVVGGTSGLVTGGTVGTVLGLGPALVTAGPGALFFVGL
eukprot:s700_g1.t1